LKSPFDSRFNPAVRDIFDSKYNCGYRGRWQANAFAFFWNVCDWLAIEKEEEKREYKIDRNVEILMKCAADIKKLPHKSKLSTVFVRRRNAAIYRLYKYFDWTPYWLAVQTGLAEWTVKYIIGCTFRSMCISDDECVFKKVFEGAEI
jgi:hypothetical protein